MIKKYLEFIKENQDNDNIKTVSVDYIFDNRSHIKKDKLKEYFIEFKNNGYDIEFREGICSVENEDFIEFDVNNETGLKNLPLYPNTKYHYYNDVTITINTKENMRKMENEEDLEYRLSFLSRLLKKQTDCEPIAYTINKFTTLDNIKINTNQYFTILNHDNEGFFISIKIPTKEIGYINAESIIKFYNWDVKKDEQDRIYIDLPYDKVIEYIPNDPTHNISANDLLNIDKFEFMNLYHNHYDSDVNSIFNYYINDETKKILIDYIIKNIDKEEISNEIEINNEKDIYSQFSDGNIISLLEDTDLLQNIKHRYVDMDNDSHGYINYMELHDDFIKVIREEASGEYLKKDEMEYFRFYYNLNWFDYYDESSDYLEDILLEDILDEYLSDLLLIVNPQMSDYGDVEEKDFSELVQELIEEHK